MRSKAVVRARAESRVRAGHLWIYRSDVASVDAEGGAIVRVENERGRSLGFALYSDRSQIALRLVTREEEEPDGAFWRDRLEAAIAYRERLAIDATAYRLVHAEADLLPSLIVDRYDEVLVVQALSQGMSRLLPEIVTILLDRLAPAGVLARHDVRARDLEGLDREVVVLHGEIPDSIVVREGDVEYSVDVRTGQKTGLFLDQRENHLALRKWGRGRALDAFSYDGGFALHLARAGADVLAVDISEDALARTSRNAERNGLANLKVEAANAFDFLREAERRGEGFDTIVLDPPAFARDRASLAKAMAGYKEINLRALKLLEPGGILATCSCSYHVGEEPFAAMLADAAADAHVRVTLLEKRMQARDHPVLVGVRETYYLKCFLLRRTE